MKFFFLFFCCSHCYSPNSPKVSLFGVVLSTTGLLLSALYIQLSTDSSIVVLYLTIGLLTGLGFGLTYLPAMDIVQHFFNRRLGLAMDVLPAAVRGLASLSSCPSSTSPPSTSVSLALLSLSNCRCSLLFCPFVQVHQHHLNTNSVIISLIQNAGYQAITKRLRECQKTHLWM